MTAEDTMLAIIDKAANGNVAARNFLLGYNQLAHAIDDLIDEEHDEEWKLRLIMNVFMFFSCDPYYQANRVSLFPLIIGALNHYATSVQWEREPGDNFPHKRMADHLRCGASGLVEFVALACGGLNNMREVTPIQWEDSWKAHHDDEGNPN